MPGHKTKKEKSKPPFLVHPLPPRQAETNQHHFFCSFSEGLKCGFADELDILNVPNTLINGFTQSVEPHSVHCRPHTSLSGFADPPMGIALLRRGISMLVYFLTSRTPGWWCRVGGTPWGAQGLSGSPSTSGKFLQNVGIILEISPSKWPPVIMNGSPEPWGLGARPRWVEDQPCVSRLLVGSSLAN